MSAVILIALAVVLATGAGHLVDRIVWPKRRKAILSGMDSTLAVANSLRVTLEDLRVREPQIAEACELALIDLSEQEAKLRRDRLIIRWT